MIFVDSGAWFAAFVPADQRHQEATAWMAANKELLVTTDYVIDETVTLIRARGERRRAILAAHDLFDGRFAAVHLVTEDELHSALDVFTRYADKDWSFTDCTSKVVMERLGLTTSFAFDQHFLQFGGINVVP